MRPIHALLILPLLLAACDTSQADFDGDGWPDGLDCVPDDATVFPGAFDEYGDGVDKNCDECPGVGRVDGIDRDCDGYPGNAERSELALYDCDDNDADVHPGAPDPDTDDIDQDCSEVTGAYACADEDEDGFCAGVDDCDDADPAVNIAAIEAMDCVDNDCDGAIDEGLPTVDADLDGSCVGGDLGFGLQCCESADLPGDCDDADYHANRFDSDGDGIDLCGPDGVAGSGDEDCDDFDPGRSPGLPEACDGDDNDCDGVTPTDEQDGDGDGLSLCAGDCDDTDELMTPWDLDLDGFSTCAGDCDDSDAALRPDDVDGDGLSSCAGDCGDGDPAIFPGAEERCNGIDDDCDGAIPTETVDADNDGYVECEDCDDLDPAFVGLDADLDNVTTCDNDCDDGNPGISPEEPDLVGDGVDQNCDGVDGTDEDGDAFASVPSGGPDCDDLDGTTYPGAADLVGDGIDQDCGGGDGVDADVDTYPSIASGGTDCDDLDAGVHPGAVDSLLDGVDQDCDGVDGAGADVDGDGDPESTDCDDLDPSRYNGAPELCDDIDSNCDGDADSDIALTWYADSDTDGYGSSSATQAACEAPQGYIAVGGDCDDSEATVHPGAPEECDGLDNDCDAALPADESDADLDGHMLCTGDCDDAAPDVYPHATEVPLDGTDQDCDGADVCFDLNCDGWPDLVFANRLNGATSILDSYIYYGGPDGFSDGDRGLLPGQVVHDVRVADFDGDGYQDILLAQILDISATNPSRIFYGSASGHSVANSATLAVPGISGMEVADVDADGMLDIVFSAGSLLTDSAVYWGDVTNGFTMGNRLVLPLDGMKGNTVADLDGDGHQDVVFAIHGISSNYNLDSQIYWGSAAGWSASNREAIPMNAAFDVAHADFDGNGYVDLVFSGYYDYVTWDQTSKVFYQDAAGFTSFTPLPSQGGTGLATGDLDGDGDIDLVICNQTDDAGLAERDSWVYWNDGGFDETNALGLPGVGALATAVGDLNLDGYPEVVLANFRSSSNEYNLDSFVYWGSAAGLSPTNVTGLPTHGAAGVRAVGPGLPSLFSTP